jgi:hypothetical protein
MRQHKPSRIPLDVRGLMRSEYIFRLTGGVKREPAVDRWLSDEPIELRSIAQKWFVEMRKCGDDVRELMHDGCPIACVEDAAFGYVNSFKSHVNVGFFYGAMLNDHARILEGRGKRMRHVKLKPGSESDEESLRELIHSAYSDIRARLHRKASCC